MSFETDFLVLGSGIAGLTFALKVAEQNYNVTLITKGSLNETNTSYAQGGIASVAYAPDQFEKHIHDTLIAGDGLCDENVVRMVVQQAPNAINNLIHWGVEFDRDEDGRYLLGREGGHSENRIFHYKDNTGEAIQSVLINRAIENPYIEIRENHFAIDIITQHHLGRKVKRSHTDIECYGAYVMNLYTSQIYTMLSKVTLIATGGSGNVYQTTTNPPVATGDGIAMTYRAKGIVDQMEFIQFHPTSLYNPGESPSFLITEALRGAGGVLKTKNGEAFTQKYDPRESLAPRDIVARAIDHEMKIRGDEYVLLDCTHINESTLKHQFPTIYQKCYSLNIDLAKDMIPVVPAAHYQCGGIRVNMQGESSIHHLYAAGEASHTGLHGANRLASNSLLEGAVYAENAASHALSQIHAIHIRNDIPEWKVHGTREPQEKVMITHNYREVQQLMSNFVGIVRSGERLEKALARLKVIYRETEHLYQHSILSGSLCELRNLINVGYLIIKMASQRKESIGLHYNVDYPPEKPAK